MFLSSILCAKDFNTVYKYCELYRFSCVDSVFALDLGFPPPFTVEMSHGNMFLSQYFVELGLLF